MRNSLFIFIASLLTAGGAFAGNFSLDKAHTNVGFEVTHMVITTVTGTFNDFEVDLDWNPQDTKNSSVKATIKLVSVDTGNQKRDDHLRTSDFFDAPNHPDMLFTSKKIENTGKGFTAYGTLSMRGISKDIELPFEVLGPVVGPWGNERIGITASTTINRQDWGVSYGSIMDNGGLLISNDVIININGQFIKSKTEDLSKK